MISLLAAVAFLVSAYVGRIALDFAENRPKRGRDTSQHRGMEKELSIPVIWRGDLHGYLIAKYALTVSPGVAVAAKAKVEELVDCEMLSYVFSHNFRTSAAGIDDQEIKGVAESIKSNLNRGNLQPMVASELDF